MQTIITNATINTGTEVFHNQSIIVGNGSILGFDGTAKFIVFNENLTHFTAVGVA